jgi:hypothetical protein
MKTDGQISVMLWAGLAIGFCLAFTIGWYFQ